MSRAVTVVEGGAGTDRQIVTARIGGQLFGMPIDAVHEVFSPEKVTRVPLSRPEIHGVLNLRGRIVTMIDMRRLLGLAPAENVTQMAVGIERNGESFGLMIDEAGEVLVINDSKREKNPANLNERWAELVDGVHRSSGELLLFLDVARVLTRVSTARAA
jgi:purine-binding chemotaxis protein CheW